MEPDVPAARPGRRPRLLVVIAPLVVLGLLVAGVVVVVLRASDASARSDARDEVLAAARQEALNLTTISYRTARQDLTRILDGATGALRRRVAAERARADVIARDRSISHGAVVSAGLMHLDVGGGVARCLVAADATVSTPTAGGSRHSTVQHYRMVVTLRRVGDRWLASDVAFDGVPR